MSVLLMKLLHYPVDKGADMIDITDNIYPKDGTPIMDCVSTRSTSGLDIKNNILIFTLKNAFGKYVTTEDDADKVLRLKEQDQIKFFLKYTDDATDITSGQWDDNSDEPSGEFLVGTYYVIEVHPTHDPSRANIEVRCADKTYILFNKAFSSAYPLTKGIPPNQVLIDTPPEIIKDVIHQNCKAVGHSTKYPGVGWDTGMHFDIDAVLFSEGIVYNDAVSAAVTNQLVDSGAGFATSDASLPSERNTTYPIGWTVRNVSTDEYATVTRIIDSHTLLLNKDIFTSVDQEYEISYGHIVNTRRVLKEDGTANSEAAFPDTSYGLVWKPVSQWVDELSQIEKTNTPAEQDSGGYVYGRPFIYWVDERNQFHWTYPEQVQSGSMTVNEEGSDDIYSLSPVQKIFGAANFIAFDGGKNLNNRGVKGYIFEPTTNIKTLKITFIPMTDKAKNVLAKELPVAEKGNGNLDVNTAGTLYVEGKSYSAHAYPTTPSWTSTAVGNDAAYIASARTEILRQCRNMASSILKGIGFARWTATEAKKGELRRPGDLIALNDAAIGIDLDNKEARGFIRVMEVSHSTDTSGWTTTLTLEQDVYAIMKAVA